MVHIHDKHPLCEESHATCLYSAGFAPRSRFRMKLKWRWNAAVRKFVPLELHLLSGAKFAPPTPHLFGAKNIMFTGGVVMVCPRLKQCSMGAMKKVFPTETSTSTLTLTTTAAAATTTTTTATATTAITTTPLLPQHHHHHYYHHHHYDLET